MNFILSFPESRHNFVVVKIDQSVADLTLEVDYNTYQ